VKPSNSLAGLASIVIPRCDPLEVTRRCITALRRHTRQRWELIVVDDGSSEPAAHARKHAGLRVVKTSRMSEGSLGGSNRWQSERRFYLSH
jgi:glycosyltransferase involved in cell wall biosynthesis